MVKVKNRTNVQRFTNIDPLTFSKIYTTISSPFHEATDTPVLDFGPRVLKPGSPACNEIHRFTSGVTPADLLMASISAEHFLIQILIHIEALMGLELWLSVLLCVHSNNHSHSGAANVRSH